MRIVIKLIIVFVVTCMVAMISFAEMASIDVRGQVYMIVEEALPASDSEMIWSVLSVLIYTIPEVVGALLLYELGVTLLCPKGPARETRCRRCNYLLFGLREPRCPECGEPVYSIICTGTGMGGRGSRGAAGGDGRTDVVDIAKSPTHLCPFGPPSLKYLCRMARSRSMSLMFASVHSQARTSANSPSRSSPPDVFMPSPARLCRAVASSPTSSISHMNVAGVPRAASVSWYRSRMNR